jgi:hypothetical protein
MVAAMLSRRLRSAFAAIVAGSAATLAVAPPAPAATQRSTSSNWAGYAVSRSGTKFRHIRSEWVQSAIDCSTAPGTYSSAWVGIGGYHQTAQALEQIGTEADCSSGGQARYSTWYEVVPDTSHSARLTIAAGDHMRASVAVAGTAVTLRLWNLTKGTSFTKVVHAPAVDTTSAEWIVEAPSLCTSTTNCIATPLANFGSMTFSAAQAVSSTGHAGTIGDPAWASTAIDLAPGGGGRRFIDARRAGFAPGGQAKTADLGADGASFAVNYQASSAPAPPTGPAQTDPGQTATPPSAALRH